MIAVRLLPLTRRLSRAPRPLARALVWAVLLLVVAAGGTTQAQGPENARAGVVIDFGDGVVEAACVDLGADGQATGEEVLAAAGFDVLIEYSPMGGAVCKIGAQGCNFPGQPCWCQCMSSPCVYWAYNYLQDGQWIYSTIGASVREVHAGDVEGWAWGAGSLSLGATPPLRTFDQICAPAAPTATPTATATWTPWPTNTPQPTPTWTPWPTNTPQPSPTWTSVPSPDPSAALPSSTLTPTWTPTATTLATAVETASPTQTATPTWTPAQELALASPTLPSPAPPDAPPATEATPAASQDAAKESPAPPASDDSARTQAVAQTTATETPSPTPTEQRLAALLPAASGAAGSRAGANDANAASLPPRLDPATGNRPDWPADRALLTTTSPDYVLLALMTFCLAAAIALARAAHRGALQPAAMARGLAAVWPRLPAQRPARMDDVAASRSDRPPGGAALWAASSRLLSPAIYGLATVVGLAALFYPFLAAALRPVSGQPSSLNGPGLMLVLLGVCFAGLLLEVQGQAVSAKLIALLGVLVAINSVLRFVEVGIPGPGGFSPVFVLIILTGYVFGGRFGFLMGALTLLVSAVFTGGVGPWLPAQMFAAGWIGLSAPLARPLVRLAGGRAGSRRELAVLAVFAAAWGLLFGAIMNLWFWPFLAGPAEQYWQAGISLAETARRYLAYYLATSLVWDALRLVGNAGLMLVFGAATLRALRRFGQRFTFQYQPEPAAQSPAAEGVTSRRRRPPVPGPVQSVSSRS